MNICSLIIGDVLDINYKNSCYYLFGFGPFKNVVNLFRNFLNIIIFFDSICLKSTSNYDFGGEK